MNTHEKIESLVRHRLLTVVHGDGRQEEWTLHQFKLAQYPQALRIAGDEIALVALACEKTKAQIEALHPECYELLQAAVWELNEKGFFAYAARQQKRGEETLAGLPPDVVRNVFKQFLSPPPPPGSRQPPA